MNEGDKVRYVGPNYPDLKGKVGKVFRLPLREIGTITVRYGEENFDGDYYELMVEHLEPVQET